MGTGKSKLGVPAPPVQTSPRLAGWGLAVSPTVESSHVSSYKGTNPTPKGSHSHRLIASHRPHHQVPSCWGLGFNIPILGQGTNIQSIAYSDSQCIGYFKALRALTQPTPPIHLSNISSRVIVGFKSGLYHLLASYMASVFFHFLIHIFRIFLNLSHEIAWRLKWDTPAKAFVQYPTKSKWRIN